VYYGETLEGAVSACTPGIRVRAPHVHRSVSVQTELHAHTSALVFVISAGYIHKRVHTRTYTYMYTYILYIARTDTRAVRRRSSVQLAARSSEGSPINARSESKSNDFRSLS